MRSRVLFCIIFLLALAMPLSVSASADVNFAITISPPSGGTGPVTIRVEDQGNIGITTAQVRLGEDGEWADITDSIRGGGWAHFEVSRSGRVFVSVLDSGGTLHVQSQQIDIAGSAPPPAWSPPPTAQPEVPVRPAGPTPMPAPAPAPAPPTGTSVTPTDGTAVVIENSVHTPAGREFFSIETERGNIFYLVIDRERPEANVYLLSEVTEEDLAGFIRANGPAAIEPPSPPPAIIPPLPEPPQAEPTPEPTAPAGLPAPQRPNNTGSIVLIAVIAIGAGGAAYYFKILKPKQDVLLPDADEEDEEEDSEDDYMDFPVYPYQSEERDGGEER